MRIDCNITGNYMDEQQRMCDFYRDCHEGCPASYICNSAERDDKKMIKIVQTWSDLNPQKTYLEDFKEKYPNGKLAEDGTPNGICPRTLGYREDDDCAGIPCLECWNHLL